MLILGDFQIKTLRMFLLTMSIYIYMCIWTCFFLAVRNYFPNLQNTFPFQYWWQQLQNFFQGLSDIHKKHFVKIWRWLVHHRMNGYHVIKIILKGAFWEKTMFLLKRCVFNMFLQHILKIERVSHLAGYHSGVIIITILHLIYRWIFHLILLLMAAASFFSGTVRYTQETFWKKLKVIGTPEDELLSYWLSFDKNHPQRCVLRKKYVFV